MGFYGGLMNLIEFSGGLMVFNRVLWWFHGILCDFYGGLIGFNVILWLFNGI